MNSGKVKLFLLFLIITVFSSKVFAQSGRNESENETLKESIEILKRYFYQDNNWYITSPSVAKDVKGLINFIEDEPVDSIITHLYSSFNDSIYYVFRLPENVDDSLYVPGYYSVDHVKTDLEKIKTELQKESQKNDIEIPESLLSELDEKVQTVPQGKGIQLFKNNVYTMPKSLTIPEVISDSVLNSPQKFK